MRSWKRTTTSRIVLALALIATPALAAPGQQEIAPKHPAGRMIGPANARLFIETEGSGRPLVLLPAGPGLDHGYFHPYLSALAPYAQVVYLDPRGCGRSDPRPPDEYTLEQMAADVEVLRRELGAGTIDLLGHGLGEAVAAAYADHHPDRVGRIVVLGAGSRASSFLDARGLQDRMTPGMKASLEASGADRYLSADGRLRERFRILAPLLFHRLTDRSFHRAFVDQVTLSDEVRESMIPRLEAAIEPGPAGSGAPRIKAPVLLVAGRHDPTISIAEVEELHRSIPGSEIAILEESGAFPFAEQPVEFLRIARKFLGGAAASAPGAGEKAGDREAGEAAGAGGGI
jgi:proline iminopeptidase